MDEREMTGTLHPQVAQHIPDQIPPKLDDIGLKYGTDKASSEHDYLRHYDDYFWLHRYDKLTLLEMGVWKGASLRMWREYFPNATIVGIDNVNRGVVIPGVDIHRCSQENETGLYNLQGLYDGFDIIVDDASHISWKTINAFQALWPALTPGGIYVIEDLQTSYDPDNYGENDAKSNPNLQGGHEWTAMEFCKRLADEVNSSLFPEQHRLGYDIASVQFLPNICFITKAGKWSTR